MVFLLVCNSGVYKYIQPDSDAYLQYQLISILFQLVLFLQGLFF
jgi:hypothetical protein